MKVSLFILSTMLIIIIIIDHFQSKNLFAQLFWPVPGIIYRGRRWNLRSESQRRCGVFFMLLSNKCRTIANCNTER